MFQYPRWLRVQNDSRSQMTGPSTGPTGRRQSSRGEKINPDSKPTTGSILTVWHYTSRNLWRGGVPDTQEIWRHLKAARTEQSGTIYH